VRVIAGQRDAPEIRGPFFNRDTWPARWSCATASGTGTSRCPHVPDPGQAARMSFDGAVRKLADRRTCDPPRDRGSRSRKPGCALRAASWSMACVPRAI